MDRKYKTKAKEMISQMSLREKVSLLSGPVSMEMMNRKKREGYHFNYFPFPGGGNERLGLLPLQFTDGPKGVVCGEGKSTCFPVPMLRGASFDEKLEEKIGHAIGREARAYGANFYGGVCVNLPYHPGWGRAQEVYGEDSSLLGSMGAALVKGVQAEHVVACVKHFAFNSIENNRFQIDIRCDKRTEREIFLPHFKECIDAGAMAVMTSYNRYQGLPCSRQRYLIRNVLKEEWGFEGFVISDFYYCLGDTVKTAEAGLDCEMPYPVAYGELLEKAVLSGRVSEETVNEAAFRIAAVMLKTEDEWKEACLKGTVPAHAAPQVPPDIHLNPLPAYDPAVIGCAEHVKLALQSAQEGITLIKNENATLPFSAKKLKRIAVLGAAAIHNNLGDHGSSRVYPQKVVTLLGGLKEELPGTELVFYEGDSLFHMRNLAAGADAVIFAVGFDFTDEGEYTPQFNGDEKRGGDRSGLGLRPAEIRMLQEVGPVNKQSAAVIFAGSTVTVSDWEKQIPAILMAYYPGQMGGLALAQILLGKVNPSGRLPFVIPERDEDLPRVDWWSSEMEYDYFHGYQYLDHKDIRPYRPFGFGLSYTEFSLRNVRAEWKKKQVIVSALVKNTGKRSGTQVVQVYASFPGSGVERPQKKLIGFGRVTLSTGKEKEIRISCPVSRLEFYNEKSGRMELEPIEYRFYAGFSSAWEDLLPAEEI